MPKKKKNGDQSEALWLLRLETCVELCVGMCARNQACNYYIIFSVKNVFRMKIAPHDYRTWGGGGGGGGGTRGRDRRSGSRRKRKNRQDIYNSDAISQSLSL